MAANLLSFDIEEYFHGPAYSHIPPSKWKDLQPRVIGNVEKILSILGKQKATFFILGWVAKKHPNLVREIYSQGHEIACHSYMHKHIWDLSAEDFKNDLTRAKREIEDVIGAGISGFRAPTFSITKKTFWALQIIKEAGFKYDSSIYPIFHDRYGIPDFSHKPVKLSDDFWEIPLSTANFFGVNIPFGGGGYFRLYPYWFTKYCIKKIKLDKTPFVFYQHPWELDDQKKNKAEKPKSFIALLRRSLQTGKPEDKLRKLISDYQFMSIREWLTSNQ